MWAGHKASAEADTIHAEPVECPTGGKGFTEDVMPLPEI